MFCSGLRRPAIAGVCEECCERGGCARLHACSCLSSCILPIPLHPSAACLSARQGLMLGGYFSLLEEAVEWLPSRTAKTLVKGEGGSEAAAETWPGVLSGSGFGENLWRV